jgi:hypothetical protein
VAPTFIGNLQAHDAVYAVPIYTFLSSVNSLKCTVMTTMQDSGRAERDVGFPDPSKQQGWKWNIHL